MSSQSSIAIIGASTNRNKYSNKAVRAYLASGYAVYPVNPRAAEVEGQKCYPSVLDIPVTPGEASFYVPSAIGLQLIEEVAAKGIRKVWLNPGAESDELIEKARSLGIEPVTACSIIAVNFDPEEM